MRCCKNRVDFHVFCCNHLFFVRLCETGLMFMKFCQQFVNWLLIMSCSDEVEVEFVIKIWPGEGSNPKKHNFQILHDSNNEL